MRVALIAAIAANLVVLVATNAVFRDWIAVRFGYLDPDMIGVSGLAWPLLAMVGTAAVGIGFALRGARWIAGVTVVLMAVVVIDHAFGAVRDGHVSALGMAIGTLMVLQCATLIVGLALAGAVGGSSARRVATAGLLAVAAVGLAGSVALAGRASDVGLREDAVETWLAELAEPPDHGLGRLAGRTMVNEDSYRRDAARVVWGDAVWWIGSAMEDDGSWSVEAVLASGPSDALGFFFKHGLARPVCEGREVVGIGVQVVVPTFGRASVEPPPMTAGQAAGRCSEPRAEEHAPSPVRWGGQPTWTGVSLEVLNRTRLDVFLVDEGGRRIDVPACGRIRSDRLSMGGMVQVRAEAGYIFAFGTDDSTETTTFVVVLSGESEMNNVPPVAVPPCEGQPQVQPGV